jgi:excisionase family DNA binding protein
VTQTTGLTPNFERHELERRHPTVTPTMNTIKQAAEKLNVSPSLVYALCKGGRIRHERCGLKRGTIRISDEALEEYRRAAQVTVKPDGFAHITP